MEKAFTEGVRPGGLTESYQVNILVCYLLDYSSQPLDGELLQEAAVDSQLVNYFELANAVSSLVQLGNLAVQGEPPAYSLTEAGKEMAAAFTKQLPLSVRERAAQALDNAITNRRQENQIVFDIQKTQDGYKMTISMKDIGTDLMSVALFLPTQESCERVRRRFLQNSQEMYENILTMLTGENIG